MRSWKSKQSFAVRQTGLKGDCIDRKTEKTVLKAKQRFYLPQCDFHHMLNKEWQDKKRKSPFHP